MADIREYLKNLTGKDEAKAKEAASYLVNSVDTELFAALVNKADYLFDFVLSNVYKRIQNAVTDKNRKNILKFFKVYSPYFDDFFADILSCHADEDLTDEIFDMLEKGTTNEKTYAAKYFSYIPDTVALESLSKYAFCDDEYLSANASEALGQMQDDTSYDIALNYINSGDDFEKLKAVKFFVSYGQKYPLKEIFKALKTSKLPENIAGQIPYTESIEKLLKSEYREDALLTVAYIVSGLGEILPLSEIINIRLYDILEQLIKESSEDMKNSGIIALIILSAYAKFTMFTENGEYIFDEDKNTKNEISSVYNLLKAQSEDFYNEQKERLIVSLKGTSDIFRLSCDVITECNIKEAAPKLKKFLSSENEVVVCEALTALRNLNETKDIDVKAIAARILNPNIKAVIESFYE